MKPPSYHLPAVHMTADDYVAVNFRLWRARPRTRFNHWLLAAAVLLLGVSVGLEVWQYGRPQTDFHPVFSWAWPCSTVCSGWRWCATSCGAATPATRRLQHPLDFR